MGSSLDSPKRFLCTTFTELFLFSKKAFAFKRLRFFTEELASGYGNISRI